MKQQRIRAKLAGHPDDTCWIETENICSLKVIDVGTYKPKFVRSYRSRGGYTFDEDSKENGIGFNYPDLNVVYDDDGNEILQRGKRNGFFEREEKKQNGIAVAEHEDDEDDEQYDEDDDYEYHDYPVEGDGECEQCEEDEDMVNADVNGHEVSPPPLEDIQIEGIVDGRIDDFEEIVEVYNEGQDERDPLEIYNSIAVEEDVPFAARMVHENFEPNGFIEYYLFGSNDHYVCMKCGCITLVYENESGVYFDDCMGICQCEGGNLD